VHCISSVRFSVLVNGSPAGFFSSSRGLMQGDPLSPFLFVIVMEVLSKMIIATVDRGFLSGFSVGSRPPAVNNSHLLFADDTLVFYRANANHLRYLQVPLLFFEAVSILVPVGYVDNMGELAGILGCGTSSLPLKYLGILLGPSYKALFGMSLWKIWSVGWPVENGCICPKVAGSPLLRAHFPTYLHTFCPSYPSLLLWLIVLRSSNERLYGEGLVKNLNIILLDGLRFALRFLREGWVSVT
jgi:hypothetical protein